MGCKDEKVCHSWVVMYNIHQEIYQCHKVLNAIVLLLKI
jgi:hypothetical protein